MEIYIYAYLCYIYVYIYMAMAQKTDMDRDAVIWTYGTKEWHKWSQMKYISSILKGTDWGYGSGPYINWAVATLCVYCICKYIYIYNIGHWYLWLFTQSDYIVSPCWRDHFCSRVGLAFPLVGWFRPLGAGAIVRVQQFLAHRAFVEFVALEAESGIPRQPQPQQVTTSHNKHNHCRSL